MHASRTVLAVRADNNDNDERNKPLTVHIFINVCHGITCAYYRLISHKLAFRDYLLSLFAY